MRLQYARENAFQSTPLMRGETAWRRGAYGQGGISIHSPHTRGDGARLPNELYERLFQSTPLTRGETLVSPLRGSPPSDFNPLPSHKGRPRSSARFGKSSDFNPLPSCEGRRLTLDFNPLPSHEGRQYKPPKIRPDLCQLTQQNHDTPLFGALQAPFCGAKPDIRGAKPTGKP